MKSYDYTRKKGLIKLAKPIMVDSLTELTHAVISNIKVEPPMKYNGFKGYLDISLNYGYFRENKFICNSSSPDLSIRIDDSNKSSTGLGHLKELSNILAKNVLLVKDVKKIISKFLIEKEYIEGSLVND